jgi:hypothetical protein
MVETMRGELDDLKEIIDHVPGSGGRELSVAELKAALENLLGGYREKERGLERDLFGLEEHNQVLGAELKKSERGRNDLR